MKKAQDLSMSTIVVAALAIIVLVVLVAIFTGKMGDVSKSLKTCSSQGGTCEYSKDIPKQLNGCPVGNTLVPGTFLQNDGKTTCAQPCCISTR